MDAAIAEIKRVTALWLSGKITNGSAMRSVADAVKGLK